MRVLAVGQVGDLLERVQQQRREVVLLLHEPARDRAVVAGGVGERLGRQRLARAERELAGGVRELLQDRVVAGRVDHDRGEGEVLGRRADHRRAADVDVLDHLVLGDAAAGRGGLERIEVHAHQVDELDLVLGGRRHVLLVVAQRQQPGVELRVQRLDAAAHDLREAREVLDRPDLEPALAQRGRGAAGRDQLDAQRSQPARELHDPGLVGDRQQRAPHLHLTRLDHRLHRVAEDTWRRHQAVPPTSTRRGWDGSGRTVPLAISRTAPVNNSCSIGRSALAHLGRLGRLGQLDRLLEDDRPRVDPLVHEVDRDAEDLHAVVERLLDRAHARERGQQRGMHVDHAQGKADRNAALSSCM